MWIEITRATRIRGKRAAPGDVVEVSDGDGRVLIGYGKAKPAEEPKKAPKKKATRKKASAD